MNPNPSSVNNWLSNLSRRDFFRTCRLAVGGAFLLGLPKFVESWTGDAEAAITKGQTVPPINLAFELDGQHAGILKSMEGGNAFAEVIREPIGRDQIQRWLPGPVRFEDIVIKVPLGIALGKPLLDWANQFFSQGSIPRNGAIVYADFNFNEVRRFEFFNALLTEIAFPSLDASSKDAAFVTLRITPQTTRLVGGKGKAKMLTDLKSKVAFSNLFRFNVQGLENACKRISRVNEIEAKRPVAKVAAGQEKFRPAGSELPGVLDCSAISLTLPLADAGPFYAWFDNFAVKGQLGDERGGMLEWLGPDMKPLGSIQFFGLGIFRIATDSAEANADSVSRVRVEMYCETMKVNIL